VFDLSGTVALITGGNSGIGLGMAQGLASAGAEVCIWGTNEDRNDESVAKIRSAHGKAWSMVVNVADELDVSSAMRELVSRTGRLDSCFANAGVAGQHSALTSTSLEDFRSVTRVNLEGVFLTFREAAVQMIELGRGGSLVATSSLACLMGQPRGHAYAASKGGIVAMVKACAIELARYGIRANAVLPGWTETPMTSAVLNSEGFKTRVLPRMPVRRWGVPEDFAAIAIYLASDEASRFHVGDTILIDGGYSIF
jgi:NAD(P)-dependent dehydrogenase (short-subunit alcohol dehydrogenase family)